MNPLINDYVKVRSRGAAMGLQNLGLTVGNILSVGVLYSLTSRISPYIGFTIMGLMNWSYIAIIYFGGMIQEPQTMNEKEQKRQGKKGFCGKVWSSLKQVYKAC